MPEEKKTCGGPERNKSESPCCGTNEKPRGASPKHDCVGEGGCPCKGSAKAVCLTLMLAAVSYAMYRGFKALR